MKLLLGIIFGLMACTVMNAAVLHVPSDYATIQSGIDAAVDNDTVLVAPGRYTGEGNRDIDFNGKAIRVTAETTAEETIIDCDRGRGFIFHHDETPASVLKGFTITGGNGDGGGGISCWESSPTILDCIITDCVSSWDGAGILCDKSFAVIANCIIKNNSGYPYSGDSLWGGGICAWSSGITLINCLVTGNTITSYEPDFSTAYAGGVMLNDAETSANIMINCTVAGNSVTVNDFGGDYGGVCCNPTTQITNCILWDNSPDSLNILSENITYCDIDGHPASATNISSDPFFTEGNHGLYYLSQTEAGQSAHSPCVDSGGDDASAICFGEIGPETCLDMLVTRTDDIADTGVVDMGFHYAAPDPGCDRTGVTLWMPSDFFMPGDLFSCRVTVCNAKPAPLTGYPLFVILDVHGQLFFAPSFTTLFDNYLSLYHTFPPGMTDIDVISEFPWPSGVGSAAGIRMIAALTLPDYSEIHGEWDTWMFGWN
jgi:hypothetical protein